MSEIRAIETRYKGWRFRSRLEARWAVFFDAAGIEWQYEPEGYDLGYLGCYLPDFFLRLPDRVCPKTPDGCGYFVEVKPATPNDVALAKVRVLARTSGHSCWLLAGVPGEHRTYKAHHFGKSYWEDEKGDWRLALRRGVSPAAFWMGFDLISMGVPNSLIMPAFDAAKAARFEHGARP